MPGVGKRQVLSLLRFPLNFPVVLAPNCVLWLFKFENMQDFYQLQPSHAEPLSASLQTKRNTMLAHPFPCPPPKNLLPLQNLPNFIHFSTPSRSCIPVFCQEFIVIMSVRVSSRRSLSAIVNAEYKVIFTTIWKTIWWHLFKVNSFISYEPVILLPI